MDVLTWILSWTVNKSLSFAIDQLSDDNGLAQRLNDATRKWGSQLEPRLDYPDPLFSLSNERGSSNLIYRKKLSKKVSDGYIPSQTIWEKALWESYIDVSERLGNDAHTFYKKESNSSSLIHIKALAIELSSICKKDSDLFKTTVIQHQATISQSIEKLIGLTEEINEKVSIVNKQFGTNVEFTKAEFIGTSRPPRAELISRREKRVSNFLQKSSQTVWVAINGSISTGKTQLSLLISERISSDVYWVNLRHVKEDFCVAEILRQLTKTTIGAFQSIEEQLSKINAKSLIVIDDLPRITVKSTIYDFMTDLVKYCRTNSITVLSTSNYSLPPSLISVIGKDNVLNCAIPPLNEDEIKEITISHGCPKDKSNEMSYVIQIATDGHPSIVTAMCRYFRDKDWLYESDEFNDLNTGKLNQDLNQETFATILKTIEDTQTRDLLFRLAVPYSNFVFDEVHLVGAVRPQIEKLNERFYSLLGLWIQNTSESEYEVSPLIRKNVFSQVDKRVKTGICSALADNILEKKVLNQFDVLKALNYFINGELYNRAGVLLINFLQYAQKEPDIYYSYGFNLIWSSVELPTEMDLFLRLYIRTIQVLIEQNSQNTYRDFLVKDLIKLIQDGQEKGVDVSSSSLLLSSIISKDDPLMSISLLKTALESSNRLKKDESFKTIFHNFSPEKSIWNPAIGIKNRDQLDGWLSFVKSLTASELASALDADIMEIACEIIQLNLLENGNSENWNSLIQDFEYLQEQALALGIDILWAEAVRGEIQVYSQKKGDIDKAQKVAINALALVENSTTSDFLIKDTIGRELFYSSKREEALKYIADAVSIPLNKFYNQKIDTFLVMSRLLEEDPTSSLYYSKEAYEYISDQANISSEIRTQVIGEYAISLSQNNKLKEAIYLMSDGYNILLESYSDSNNEQIIVLRYAHVLNYWLHLISGKRPPDETFDGQVYIVPKSGMFNLNGYPIETMKRYFFPERKFLGMFVLLECFEYLGDFKRSKFWSQKALNSDKGNPIKIFFTVYNRLSIYTIFSGELDQGIEIQLDAIERTNIFIDNPDSLRSEYDNEVIRFMLSHKPKSRIDDYDEILLEFYVVPLLFFKARQLITGVISRKEFAETLKSFLEKWSRVLIVRRNFTSIVEMIELFDDDIISGENCINFANDFDEDMPKSIKVIAYILASIYAPPIEALRVHLALIKRVDDNLKLFSRGVYSYIILPFFEDFWNQKYEQNKTAFEDNIFWMQRSWPYFQNAEYDLKLKSLFKILCHHLNFTPTRDIDEWIHD